MPLDWFNGQEAVSMGAALADQLAQRPQMRLGAPNQPSPQVQRALHSLLERADDQLRTLRLNFYKRAKLANAFKWRLLEIGVDKPLVESATRTLLLHLMSVPRAVPQTVAPTAEPVEPGVQHAQDRSGVEPRKGPPGNFKRLLAQASARFAAGDYEQARAAYEQLVALKPKSADAHNGLGAALFKLERFSDAWEHFQQAVKLRPDYPEGLFNLGAVLYWQGYFDEAVRQLRRAVTLRPQYAEPRSLLGTILALQGHTRDAQHHLEKVLKTDPNHVESLLAMGKLAATQGRFEEAESWYRRALEQPRSERTPTALASLAGLRRMSRADAPWLERALQLAGEGIPLSKEAILRFAIGKYYDDVGEYPQAFGNFERANEILKRFAAPFSHAARVQFVDDMIRAYSPEHVAAVSAWASESERPVFVIGMPRSGTTLAEQIIAAHPRAAGAGEQDFWGFAGRRHIAEIHDGQLPEATARQLGERYLRLLGEYSEDALRVVDKAPLNADYVGLIHSVLPRARFIWMRRDPIDTCLSCFFQPFTLAMNFTMSLPDLELYYRQQHRLMKHWRAVMPAGTLLEVHYEQLVADQAGLSRRILEFIGLDWDERCLEFHRAQRNVSSASAWQVRQKVYSTSIARWRKYEKFIGPLSSLKSLEA